MKRQNQRKMQTKRYRNRLRECRLRALVPMQSTLARMTGISPTTINALENHRLFLSAPNALRIATALKCRLDDLYERCESEEDVAEGKVRDERNSSD